MPSAREIRRWCAYCGRELRDGEARIGLVFTLDELEQIARDVLRVHLRDRAIKAIALLDEERADRLYNELCETPTPTR